MGCHAITPHLVSLAKRLEGRPFHLIASHCQNNSQENVVAYLKSQGLSATTPNFTLTSFGRHPKVKGNGYVPYYMVFDHRGKLVREHMCGDYHGGDGLGMIDWVERMLIEAPDIYLGEEPFVVLKDLAEDITSGRKLAASMKKLEAALQSEDSNEAEEAQRLHGRMTAWRDARLKNATDLLATTPSEVLPTLQDLAKNLKGSALGDMVLEKIKELKSSPELKAASAIESVLEKVEKRLQAMDACKTCRRAGHDQARLSCADCRAENRRSIDSLKAQLDKSLDGNEELPIAARLRTLLTALKAEDTEES